jgi:replicative superfamily II helicase
LQPLPKDMDSKQAKKRYNRLDELDREIERVEREVKLIEVEAAARRIVEKFRESIGQAMRFEMYKWVQEYESGE